MLRDSLSYPVRGQHAEAVLLGGYALLLLGAVVRQFPVPLSVAAVVPWLGLLGYYGRAFRSTLEGATDPPSFGGVVALARDALTVLLLVAAYLLLPALYAVFLAGAGLFENTAGNGVPSVSPVATLFGTMLLFLVLAAVYVLPAAIATAFEASSVRAGLAVRGVVGRTFTHPYSTGVALAFVLVVLAGLLSRGITALVPSGELVGLALTYYLHLTAVRLLGRGVAERPTSDTSA